MSYFNRLLETVDQNRTNEFNSIPFGLPKLDNIIPGIMKSTYYSVTSGTKVGKSIFADNIFVYNPINYALAHNIPLKIWYYSMEMSMEQLLTRGISRNIFKRHGIAVQGKDILSLSKNKMTDDIYNLIRNERVYFENFEKIVTIREGSINPYGIFKEVSQYCEANGNFKENGKYDDRGEFRLVIADHLSLLTREKGMDLRNTIEKYSADCVKLRNKYGVSFCNIQQQSLEKEKAIYTNTGAKIENKHEPTIDGLGDCKYTARDCDVMFGLYCPQRYGIKSHNNIDNRSLKVMLNRQGDSDLYIPLLFNGACNLVNEM